MTCSLRLDNMSIGCNYLWLCLFGTLACFLTFTEAVTGGTKINSRNLMPWQVSVQDRGNKHICGAGMIRNQFALTAASCVTDEYERKRTGLSVLVYLTNLHQTNPPPMRVTVEHIRIVPEFRRIRNNYIGDLAVLKLSKPVHNPNRAVQNGTHWIHMQSKDNLEKRAVIAGFGWNEIQTAGNFSDGQLRYNIVKIISHFECALTYPQELIHQSKHMCAKVLPIFKENKHSPSGACKGDIGGMLVLEDHYADDEAMAVGVLSKFAKGCDEREGASIYTRISYYKDFILDSIVKSELHH